MHNWRLHTFKNSTTWGVVRKISEVVCSQKLRKIATKLSVVGWVSDVGTQKCRALTSIEIVGWKRVSRIIQRDNLLHPTATWCWCRLSTSSVEACRGAFEYIFWGGKRGGFSEYCPNLYGDELFSKLRAKTRLPRIVWGGYWRGAAPRMHVCGTWNPSAK